MASDALIAALIKDVSEGLEVLRVRDGVELTVTQIAERARNIVANLVGNYFVASMDTTPTLSVGNGPPLRITAADAKPARSVTYWGVPAVPRTERPAGVVPWHGWSCACETCHTAKQKDRQ